MPPAAAVRAPRLPYSLAWSLLPVHERDEVTLFVLESQTQVDVSRSCYFSFVEKRVLVTHINTEFGLELSPLT